MAPSDIGLFLVALFVVSGAVALWLFLLRYIFQYKFKDRYLCVSLFGLLSIRQIRLTDVIQVRTVSKGVFLPRELTWELLWAEAWPSWIFSRTAVLIRKKYGFSRRLVFTPRSADEFIREIERRREPDK